MPAVPIRAVGHPTGVERGRLTTSLVLGACALFAAPRAHAQTQRFQLDRYVLPVSTSDLFWLERPVVAPSLRPGVVAAVGYQHDPLRSADAMSGAVVQDDVRSHLAASIGLFNFIQVGAALPIVLLTSGQDSQTNSGPSATASAFGDLRLDLRMRMVGPAFGPGGRLAVAGSVMFPTGNRQAYAGDGSVTGSARLLAEVETRGGIRLVGNAGVVLRPTIVTPVYTVGNEVFLRAGFMFPMTRDRQLAATAEATATTGLGAGFLGRNETSVEIFTGAKYTSDSGTVMGLGVGVGLTTSVGTPEFRALLTMGRGYVEPVATMVHPGDDDRDGVLNADDRCPTVRMGEHPDPTRRGCPSSDGDRDGYIDPVDDCPDLAAGTRPDFSRPGCPLSPERPDPEPVASVSSDRDGDGIRDDADACPDDPGLDEGARGCPRWVRSYDGAPVLVGEVRFAAGSARVRAECVPMLDELALWLAAHGEVRMRIAGRGQSRGESAAVSRARAEAVRAWLVARGVDGARLEAVPAGDNAALADESTPEGRALNRRVDFSVVPAPEPLAEAAVTRPRQPVIPASVRPSNRAAPAIPR